MKHLILVAAAMFAFGSAQAKVEVSIVPARLPPPKIIPEPIPAPLPPAKIIPEPKKPACKARRCQE